MPGRLQEQLHKISIT